MKNIAVTKCIAKFTFIIILLFSLSTQVFSQSIAINMGGQEIALINTNRSLVTNNGNSGLSAGSVWRYDNLITTGGITVYGILTITAMNNATLGVLDDETAGTGSPARFQPTLNTTAANGYVSFELDFYELYTNENVYISNYYMTGVDVDGPEFYEISGYSSYIVDATCVLKITPSTILSNGTRFASGGSELSGITFDNTSAFIAKFPHPSTKINFVIGANAIVSTNRQFSAQFGSMGGVFTTIETNYNPNPILSITKTASPSIFSPGNVSQYSINVSNGANTVDQVTLTDVLPSEMTYVPNSTSAYIPASNTTKTVKDEFTTVAYTNQNGVAGIWTTNWVDNDLNASSGTIFISGGKLNFSNLIVGDQIVRTANLMPTGSTSGGATLTFDYDLSNSSGLGASQLIVQLSPDGTTYTTVGTLTGNGTGTFSYTLLPAQITSNTYLKFAISGAAWASTNKIAKIDNVQISYVYNKPDVTRTNAIGGTLTDGLPSGSLVASADAITLEPGVSMTVTFNVLVACTASGTKVNTATSSCTGLTTPVSATCSNPIGPVSTGTAFCAAGPVSLTASGAASNQVYRWYSASSGGSVLYTGNPYTTPSISVTTTYYVTLYNSGTGCESVRVPVIATYAPLLGTAVINELTAKNGGSSYLDDQSSVGFSCTGVTGATSYLWTIPAGATFASPSTGSTIYVNFNSAGQNGAYNVCVTPSNSCNTGTQTCLSINITRSGSDGISGNVYYDADGSVAPLKVNGTGIGSIGGQQLYAVLYDKTNAAVVESQPIASDGTYLFMGLRSTASNYNIYITTNNYVINLISSFTNLYHKFVYSLI